MTEFRLLGSLEALDGDRSLALGGHRQRAVLAVLLLRHGEVVSVDAIVDAVWGEQVPKTAVAYLQNCISRLRGQLGHEAIETRAPGYALRVDPGDIDAVRFSRLVGEAAGRPAAERFAALSNALALWRGTALADFVFEDFAQPAIRHLNALRLEAIEGRIEAQLELGRQVEVIAEIEALAAAHPSHERLRYLQMLALYRSGRQVDALAVFQDSRLALAEELGLEPSEELKALERMILDHDPSLDSPTTAEHEPSKQARAERRIVTILRAAPMVAGDPEADPPREVAAGWLALASAAVGRHGGALEQPDGTEIVATFGLGAAREDDALRAVRAGSEIREESDRLGTDWRCRIETHELLTGDGRRDGGAVSAARAQTAISTPNAILLDPDTMRLLSGAVEAVPAGDGSDYRLLGLVDGAPPVRRRFDAVLVGREPELDRLDAAVADIWRKGAAGSVVVLGEPGIGKTRLAAALAERLDGRALTTVGRCVPYGEGSSYLPLLDIIRGAVGPGELRRRVARRLGRSSDAARVAECLADIGGEPAARNADVLWAARRFLEIVSEDRPLLVVLDDLHWAEPLLLDLVEYLVGWCHGPVALVNLARPELLEKRPGWAQGAVELDRLSADASQALLAAFPQSDRFDQDVVATMLRTAEGNPLFLEQIAAMAADQPLEAGQVPPTLEALLASRLDALPREEHDVLERAAVVGREFWRAAVEALSPGDELGSVGPGLMALVRRRFVRPDRGAAPGEDGFRFEHVLIRDATYASIPGGRRSGLHERLALWLDGQPGASPEVVGFHLEAAARGAPESTARRDRLAAAAATRLGEAGHQAILRLDVAGAARLYRRAVELLPPDLAQRRAFEVELGHALKYEGKMAESVALLESVERYAQAEGDLMLQLRATIELAFPRLVAGDISAKAVRALADETEPVFVAANDFFTASRAARLHYNADDVLMQFARADEDIQRCTDYRRRAGVAPLEVTYRALSWVLGPMPVETARGRISVALDDDETSQAERAYLLMYLGELDAMHGSFDDARKHLAQSKQLHLEFSQEFALVTAWPRGASAIERLAGDPLAAAETLGIAAAQVDEHANVGWFSSLVALGAASLVEAGHFEEAISLAESARTVAPSDELIAQVVWRSALARALAATGNDADGEPYAIEAVELARTTEAPGYQAEALVALAEAGARRRAPAATAAIVGEALQRLTDKGNTARIAQIQARAGA